MIRVSGLSKFYSDTPALQGVSFELAPGERLALVGPSGSGKTTLLRLLAGLEVPDEGEINLGGQLVSRPGWAAPPYARGIGMAFQSPTLWPHMTVLQNLQFGLNGTDAAARQQVVEELAQAFGLISLLRRYPGQLSGGEARRAALGRALAPRHPILLLDEPLTSLNVELKEQVFAAAVAFIDRYRPAVLLVTHDPAEAGPLGARLMRLEKGRIV